MDFLLSHKFPEISIPFSWRRVWVVLLIVCVFFGVGFFGLVSYANTYTNHVFSGVSIGSVPIGGMTRDELVKYIELMHTKFVRDGIVCTYTVHDVQKTCLLYPSVVSDDTILEFVHVDAEREADFFVSYRKDGGSLTRAWSAFNIRLSKPSLTLQYVTANQDQLLIAFQRELGQYETPNRNASVSIDEIVSLTDVAFTMVTSSSGISFQYDNAVRDVVSSWSRLKSPEIVVSSINTEPTVTEEHVRTIVGRLPNVFAPGGLDVHYTDSHTKRDSTWHITEVQLKQWLDVQPIADRTHGFGLKRDAVVSFLESTIAPMITVSARNARFAIGDGGKVKEFLGSRPGVTLDIEKTYQAINEAILQRTWHDEGVAVSVRVVSTIVEPVIKTGEVNDLGINEILGVGYSNFSGSPVNRVKNIRHAISDKLNGLLIKPGETFSALEALRPFTIEDGYLPELVIKGDKIIPEIAGGLCQIGSTLFRMAMNAGRPIVERRNHSLVVGYYNDHRNGLPGTDATIYDASPDFKFQNNTNAYMLITTEMNEKTGELTFTLWGTSDQTTGQYSEPVVEQWIPAGETKIIETTDMKPGEKKCQSKHNGAVASFVYTITHSDGTKEDREFRSFYRALPEICLVGVEPSIVSPTSTEQLLVEQALPIE